MVQRLRPQRSNAERRNLRKKANFSQLEVVPLQSEVEVKQGPDIWKQSRVCACT